MEPNRSEEGRTELEAVAGWGEETALVLRDQGRQTGLPLRRAMHEDRAALASHLQPNEDDGRPFVIRRRTLVLALTSEPERQ